MSWTICGPSSPRPVRTSRSTRGSNDCSTTGPCASAAPSRRSSSVTSSAMGRSGVGGPAGRLELGEHADRAVVGGAGAGEPDHLGEGQDAEAPVVGGVQRPQLRACARRRAACAARRGEVLGEPAGGRRRADALGGAAVGELRPPGDVGGQRQLALVADDEDAVAADDDVGLDQFGTEVDRQLEAGGRVLGPVGGGPAVADDEGQGRAGRWSPCRRLGRAHVRHTTGIGWTAGELKRTGRHNSEDSALTSATPCVP